MHSTPSHVRRTRLVRRPVGCREPKEFKYYLSTAPETVALAEMAWVGCARWTIEEDFELAKGELGLDHYEVTRYRGWYHHVTLVLLALAFLKSVQRAWGKKEPPGDGAGDPSAPGSRPPAGRVDPADRDCLVRAPAAPEGCRSTLPPGALAA